MQKSLKALERQRLRQKLAKACRLLSRKELVAHAEGNVSCRVVDDLFLIKISGTSFRGIRPEDFVLINEKGEPLNGGEPSIENPLHIEIYKQIPEVNFIIHTHPTNVRVLSSRPIKFLEIPTESHAFQVLRKIPVIGPFRAGSRKLAKAAATVLRKTKGRAVIVKGQEPHGLVVIGHSLEEAFDLTEFVEKIAYEKLRMNETTFACRSS